MRRILKGQRGFTLIELLVASGITAMIAAVVGSSLFQMGGLNERVSDRLKALHDLDNASHWIYLDGPRAEETYTTSDPPTMTLRWREGDEWDEWHSVTYSLSGTNLQRNHDGKVSTVARYISSVGFSLSYGLITDVQRCRVSDGLIMVAMTSSPGGRSGISKEMTLKVWPRPLPLVFEGHEGYVGCREGG